MKSLLSLICTLILAGCGTSVVKLSEDLGKRNAIYHLSQPAQIIKKIRPINTSPSRNIDITNKSPVLYLDKDKKYKSYFEVVKFHVSKPKKISIDISTTEYNAGHYKVAVLLPIIKLTSKKTKDLPLAWKSKKEGFKHRFTSGMSFKGTWESKNILIRGTYYLIVAANTAFGARPISYHKQSYGVSSGEVLMPVKSNFTIYSRPVGNVGYRIY